MFSKEMIRTCIHRVMAALEEEASNSSQSNQPSTASSSTENVAAQSAVIAVPLASLPQNFAHQLGNPTQTPSTPMSILREVRDRFSPYQMRRPARTSVTGSSSNIIPHTQVFVCLAGPDDKTIPKDDTTKKLTENGLGKAEIGIDRTSTSSEIERKIRQAYPKLAEHPFELLVRCSLGRKNGLMPFSPTGGFPDGKELIGRRRVEVFVRPSVQLYVPEVTAGSIPRAIGKVQRFFALDSPLQLTAPTRDKENTLNDSGLGHATVRLNKEMSSEEVEQLLRMTYTKFGTTAFQVLRKRGPTKTAHLDPVDPEFDVPDGNSILGTQKTLLYLRPRIPLQLNAERRPSQATSRFMQIIVCLGNHNERNIPSEDRKSLLQSLGLGEKSTRLDKSDTVEVVETKIRRAFPRLLDAPFQMMRESHVLGDTRLLPINYFNQVEDGQRLFDASIPTVYVRPMRPLDQDNEGDALGIPTITLDETHQVQAQVQAQSTSNRAEPEMDIQADNQLLEPSAIAMSRIEDVAPLSLPYSTVTATFISERTPSQLNGEAEIMASTSGNVILGSEETDMELNDNDEDVRLANVLEIKSFRSAQHNKFPGEKQLIEIARDDMESLLSIYKEPGFAVEKKTNVRYEGEGARDYGAVTKEFFLSSMKMLRCKPYLGKHYFFSGEVDHLIPNIAPMLYTHSHFHFLGKFIGHSIIQTGIGFVGLSDATVRYLFRGRADLNSLKIREQDIPCLEAREAFCLLRRIHSGEIITTDEMNLVTSALAEAGIPDIPNQQNALLISEQLACQVVCISRDAYFASIRDGFKETDAFTYFKDREELWGFIFPKSTDFVVNAEDVLALTTFIGEESDLIRATIESYILSLGSEDLSKLLQAWTGWNKLPDDVLKVEVKSPGTFVFHACFNTLEVPLDIDPEALVSYFKNALMYGYQGFGSA